jgi:hypothetical protein
MPLKDKYEPAAVLFLILLLSGVSTEGCARLPYTTKVVHEDQRVAVFLQREVKPAATTQPVQLTSLQIAAILRGVSLREQQRLPLRWFAEEAPPKKLFREDELEVLAPQLVPALQQVGPDERVYFEVFAPGLNPTYRRDVTGGWIAVRDRLFQLTVDYFHVQQPIKTTDDYDPNYPTPWTPPKTYLLYFEPGRFYVTDPKSGTRGVDFREFLKTSSVP